THPRSRPTASCRRPTRRRSSSTTAWNTSRAPAVSGGWAAAEGTAEAGTAKITCHERATTRGARRLRVRRQVFAARGQAFLQGSAQPEQLIEVTRGGGPRVSPG